MVDVIKSLVSPRSGIYGLRNKTSGKWYIGQTKNTFSSRWSKYKRLACKSQCKLYNALLKYGYNDFEKVVLENVPPENELLNSREIFWSDYYNSIDDGYNTKLCGGSKSKFTKESREKMSKAQMGKKLSLEHKNRIGDGNRGKIQPLDAVAKTTLANTGRKHSEETKKKMSTSRLGKKREPFSQEHRDKISESCRITKQLKKGNICIIMELE